MKPIAQKKPNERGKNNRKITLTGKTQTTKCKNLFIVCSIFLLLLSLKSTCSQPPLNIFVSVEPLLPHLSVIHPYEKCSK